MVQIPLYNLDIGDPRRVVGGTPCRVGPFTLDLAEGYVDAIAKLHRPGQLQVNLSGPINQLTRSVTRIEGTDGGWEVTAVATTDEHNQESSVLGRLPSQDGGVRDICEVLTFLTGRRVVLEQSRQFFTPNAKSEAACLPEETFAAATLAWTDRKRFPRHGLVYALLLENAAIDHRMMQVRAYLHNAVLNILVDKWPSEEISALQAPASLKLPKKVRSDLADNVEATIVAFPSLPDEARSGYIPLLRAKVFQGPSSLHDAVLRLLQFDLGILPERVSDNMREVVEKFDFDNTINKLEESGLLFMVLERFKNIDLHPDKVSNLEMGYVFEELIRKFNEAMDENPGEHFTPREVIRLMVNLLLTRDKEALAEKHIVRTVYDCCCGSGGMLTIAKDRIHEINSNADVHLFGQEVNPETFAVCKSDLFMKSADGRDAENIMFGSTLGKDQHSDKRFDYLLTNPPFGKEWKMDQKAVEAESERGYAGRFGAGLPRISDGQLLFLQHLLCRMKDTNDGGSRVAIVMNGSPLFTGDAGSGESEIRRWILESDWLEAIIAMPEQLFYNTGIPTYVWVLTNRKPKARKTKVQLIDATSIWTPMRKSMGDKRREITQEQIGEITRLFELFKESPQVRIFKTTDFGYRKITVERPLRLNFQASPNRIERILHEKAVFNLSTSKKKGKAAEEEIEAGRKLREAILKAVTTIDSNKVWKNRKDFITVLDKALVGLKVPAAVKKAILSALAQRDETADICTDDEGQPEADPELRDTENVPMEEDVTAYFEREVKPHVPDAWVSTEVRDHKDGEVGKVGYEINFNRYFYQYQPPRELELIEADIKGIEKDILAMLKEVIRTLGETSTEQAGPRLVSAKVILEWLKDWLSSTRKLYPSGCQQELRPFSRHTKPCSSSRVALIWLIRTG